MLFIRPILALAALFSLPLAAADRLFVFDANSTSAAVFQAPNLIRSGTATVPKGAFAAFGAGEKIYVVATDRVTMLDDNLRPLGEIALTGGATAATLDPHTSQLLVAAGMRLYRIDTATSRIASVLEVGSVASALHVPMDARLAYWMTAGSRQVRIIDLQADRVLPGTADLAATPSVFAEGLIGAGSETFSATPLFGGAAGSFPRTAAQPALLAASTSGARLLRANGALLHATADGLAVAAIENLGSAVVHAALSPEGGTAYLALADGRIVAVDARGERGRASAWTGSAPTALSLVSNSPQQVTITKASGDLQAVIGGAAFEIAVTGPTGGIPMTVESNSPAAECETVPPLSGLTAITCTSTPVTTTTTVTLTVSAIGTPVTFTVYIVPAGLDDGLFLVSGDNQTVDAGDTFSLVVEARLNGLPRVGAALTVTDTSTAFDCPAVGLTTNAGGRATITCTVAATVPTSHAATITVSDAFSHSVQFTASVVGQTGPNDALVRISPNPLTVFEGQSFNLTVQATLDGTAQQNVPLTISASNAAVQCPAAALTGVNGQATLGCGAGQVNADTAVEVTFSDGSNMVAFSITVKNATVSNCLQKVSGDAQVVAPNTQFPLPLVVRAVTGGQPDESLLLTVTVNSVAATCSVSTLTDANGLGSITCTAGAVAGTTVVEIQVKDAANRTLSQPFTATIAPNQGDGEAEEIVVLSGANLASRPGDTLTGAIQVRTEAAAGGTVGGVNVFARGPEGVTLHPAVAQSGPNGLAVFDVAFGCAPATGQIQLGLTSTSTQATVNYTLSSGALSQFRKVQGDSQTGVPGQRLPLALLVESADQCGAILPNVPLAWAVIPPDAATLEAVVSTTNAQGLASVLVRPSARGGAYQVRAVAVQDANIAATFALTTQNAASQIQLVSGNQQSVPAGSQAPLPLVVRVLSTASQPVQGINVAFQITSGSGALGSAAVVTDAQGRATTIFTAGQARGPVNVRASAAGQTVNFTLTVGGGAPQLQVPGFVNGASFLSGFVSGSTGTIFGVNITGDLDGAAYAPYDPSNGFPTLFLGVRVTVGGLPAPILSMANVNGQEQINIQVPFGLAQGTVTVVVENDGTQASVAGIPIFGAQPGIFEYYLGGQRYAGVLHANYDLVTPTNPARPGELLLLYLTGLGRVTPPVATNQAGPLTPLSTTVLQPRVLINGVDQQIDGSYYAPQLLTVYQINFRLSSAAQPGPLNLAVSIDGVQSQRVTLPVGAAF